MINTLDLRELQIPEDYHDNESTTQLYQNKILYYFIYTGEANLKKT